MGVANKDTDNMRTAVSPERRDFLKVGGRRKPFSMMFERRRPENRKGKESRYRHQKSWPTAFQ